MKRKKENEREKISVKNEMDPEPYINSVVFKLDIVCECVCVCVLLWYQNCYLEQRVVVVRCTKNS